MNELGHLNGERVYFCSTSGGAVTASALVPKPSGVWGKGDVPLSPREREVLTLIAQGGTNREIARRLSISMATVDTHRTNLMRKLKIRNIAGLVVYAFRAGLIDLPH